MSPRIKILLASLLAVVVVAGAGIWWFFRGDEPAEVSLDSAASSVDDAPGGGGGDASVDGIDGTWTVDAESGDFDYERATGTFVGFRVAEELSSVGSTEAVGRTGEVTGSITIDGTTLTRATVEADLLTLTTNRERRDDRVHEALETGAFPTATFELTEPVDLGDSAAAGGSVAVTAPGELTIHGVTRAVEVPIEARLVDGTIVVVGSLDIVFADFGVEVPTAPVVLSADDHGTVELQLLLTRA